MASYYDSYLCDGQQGGIFSSLFTIPSEQRLFFQATKPNIQPPHSFVAVDGKWIPAGEYSVPYVGVVYEEPVDDSLVISVATVDEPAVRVESLYSVSADADNGYFTGWGEYFSGGWHNYTCAPGRYAADSSQGAWFVFRNINAPNGFKVQESSVFLTCLNSEFLDVKIAGCFALDPNGVSPGSSANGFSCAKTSLVPYNYYTSVFSGQRYEFGGLADSLSQVFALPGWTPGNSVCFYLVDVASAVGSTFDLATLGNGAATTPTLRIY